VSNFGSSPEFNVTYATMLVAVLGDLPEHLFSMPVDPQSEARQSTIIVVSLSTKSFGEIILTADQISKVWRGQVIVYCAARASFSDVF
jgi:hypothetical protein